MQKETLIRQILYRSSHRGCKETDILLGKFIEKKISDFDDKKLQLYNKFIEEDDLLIYDWIMRKITLPEAYVELIKEIQAFHDV